MDAAHVSQINLAAPAAHPGVYEYVTLSLRAGYDEGIELKVQ
jgi:hypothetical protein